MKSNSATAMGLSFGLIMTVFFIVQGVLINEDHSNGGVLKSVAVGLLSGVLSGVLFGFLMCAFSKSKLLKEADKIQLRPGETVLFETTANHFKGIEAVGGKLYLTTGRLVFKSHKLNFQNHQLSINLSEIDSVERHRTLGFFNNKLSIKLQEKKEKFVVEQREIWIKLLSENKPVTTGS